MKYGLRKRTLKKHFKQITLSKCGQTLCMKSIEGSESSFKNKSRFTGVTDDQQGVVHGSS